MGRRIVDLHDVLTRILRVYGREAAAMWLVGSEPLLGGARPIDVLALEGAAPLIRAIDGIAQGVYAGPPCPLSIAYSRISRQPLPANPAVLCVFRSRVPGDSTNVKWRVGVSGHGAALYRVADGVLCLVRGVTGSDTRALDPGPGGKEDGPIIDFAKSWGLLIIRTLD
jgi:hypothetical protein